MFSISDLDLSGVFPAMVTPFDEEGNVDVCGVEDLTEFLLEKGVHGLVPCGPTGEFTSMSREERAKVIETVVKKKNEIDEDKPVIAGAGASSTGETIKLVQEAEKIGADAALIVNPYYLKANRKETYEYCERINEIGFPIVFHNNPQNTGSSEDWRTLEGISKFNNFIGILDSSGEIAKINTMIEKMSSDVQILCGDDEIAHQALTGIDGCILSTANIIPEYWNNIFQHISKGEHYRAHETYAEISKLVRIISRNDSVTSTKYTLEMCGLPAGPSRKPLTTGDAGGLTYVAMEELRIQLEKFNKVEKKEVIFKLSNKSLTSELPEYPETPDIVENLTFNVGEALAGRDPEVAHIDMIIGEKKGIVEKSLDRALQNPTKGHKTTLIKENPKSLLVPTLYTKNQENSLFYKNLAEGVKKAIEDSKEDGYLPEELTNEVCLIINAFLHPSASNKTRIEMNNYKATRHAIRRAIEERPTSAMIDERCELARHPFKYSI